MDHGGVSGHGDWLGGMAAEADAWAASADAGLGAPAWGHGCFGRCLGAPAWGHGCFGRMAASANAWLGNDSGRGTAVKHHADAVKKHIIIVILPRQYGLTSSSSSPSPSYHHHHHHNRIIRCHHLRGHFGSRFKGGEKASSYISNQNRRSFTIATQQVLISSTTQNHIVVFFQHCADQGFKTLECISK